MGAGIVGDELGRADRGEVGEARIRDLDRRVQRRDGGDNLVGRVFRVARGEVAAHPEGEFRLGDTHPVAGEVEGRSDRDDALGENTAGEGTVDVDVRLAGLAGRGDLPAEERPRSPPLDQRLDRVALGPCPRTDRFRDIGDGVASLPGPPEKIRGGLA